MAEPNKIRTENALFQAVVGAAGGDVSDKTVKAVLEALTKMRRQ